jgi:hypothetical protein
MPDPPKQTSDDENANASSLRTMHSSNTPTPNQLRIVATLPLLRCNVKYIEEKNTTPTTVMLMAISFSDGIAFGFG